MCGRARFAILANRQIRRFTGENRGQQQGNNQARTRRGRDPVTRSHNQVEDQGDVVPHDNLAAETEHNDSNDSSSSSSSNEQEFHKIENCCPGMTLPILRYDESQQKVIVEKMVWGLIPPFQKGEKPDHYSMFNKRIESFTPENHYFNRLLSAKRCIIVFDGFYEWKLIAGKKQPYYVYLKKPSNVKEEKVEESGAVKEKEAETEEEKEADERAPLMMAGIWEDFKHDSSNPWLEGVTKSFSIITGMPSNAFKDVHNRQPIFLTDEQAKEWLNPRTSIFPLLKTVDKNSENDSLELNQSISFHPVNKKMTDPKYQSSDCSAPYSLGGNMSSFLIKGGSSAAVRPTSTSVEAMCSADAKKSSTPNRSQSPDHNKSQKLVGEKRKLDSVDLTDSFSPNGKSSLSSPMKAKRKITQKIDGGISKFFVKR
jgi:putative SOS response-associated peptidase YedK